MGSRETICFSKAVESFGSRVIKRTAINFDE